MPQIAVTGEETKTLAAVEPDDLYEIVDGQIVEKTPMGAYQGFLGSRLMARLEIFASTHDCGHAVCEVLFNFGPNMPQRRPDAAYISYQRWPRRQRIPSTNAWVVVPELAVEVISPSNTFEEVLGKVQEYFQAGVQTVWVIAPPQQQVYVYQSPTRIQVVTIQEALTGEPFLPEFRLALTELFDVEAPEA